MANMQTSASHTISNELLSIADSKVASWSGSEKKIDRYSILSIAMASVESYAVNHDLTGAIKHDLAIKLAPSVAQFFVRKGKLSQTEADVIKGHLSEHESVSALIEVIIGVSKDPNAVNASKWVAKKVKKGCFACFGK